MKHLIKAGIINLLFILMSCLFTSLYAQDHSIVSQYGKYSFSYNQVPEPLVSLGTTPAGYAFQWESTTLPTGVFNTISGATSSTLTFSVVLAQTSFYRRKATSGATVIYSNIVKLELVSVNWENINYVREHNLLVPGQTDWKVIDQLPVGSKLQTTTYMDGLGRNLQTVSRETATPADPSNPSNLWGDMVQFSTCDVLGRQPKSYLPYTTVTQSGKYKTAPLTEQPAYYTSVYNESSAYSIASYDGSPLSRVTNVKGPGTS